jgi:hypothetical protein
VGGFYVLGRQPTAPYSEGIRTIRSDFDKLDNVATAGSIAAWHKEGTMVSTRLAVVGLFLMASSGCSAHATPESGPMAPRTAGAPVLVENQSATTVRISAMFGNNEIALGRGGAMEQRTFRMPEGMGGTVRLLARPAAQRAMSQPHVSEPFEINRDARISWELRMSPGTSDLPRMSTIRVFSCVGDPRC